MLRGKLFSGIVFMTTSLLMLTISSCKKDDDDENKFKISGNANGAQEVPAVTTTGTGTITGAYDSEDNTLTYTITWTGLQGNVNNMHFHGPADATVSAGVQIGIDGWPATPSGTVSGTATLNEVQEVDLLAGKWYYNIHTTFKGTGEIRGNITATPD
jgi:hypothetical protein